VRAPKLAHRLIADLSDRIRNGSLAPGSKLPTEHEIMRETGVSRAVVREAITRLQAAGLVEARQGVGTFVLESGRSANFPIDPATVITMGDVLALLELRMSFETESAALAALRHTPEQLREMHDSIERIQRHLETDGETKKLDFEFHLKVASATGNRYFSELLNHLGLAILPRTRVDLRYIAGNNTFDYLNRSNQEHREIYAAIARRDPASARAAMRTHLNNSREHLRQLYETAEGRPAAG
jgi:GntR family transcriptional repressor for pyruvate dehydrogenase complex